jgi:hypothetical protein
VSITGADYCLAAEQTMLPNMEIAADRRFLEFDVGDWSVLLGGFMLAGLLVWLI